MRYEGKKDMGTRTRKENTDIVKNAVHALGWTDGVSKSDLSQYLKGHMSVYELTSILRDLKSDGSVIVKSIQGKKGRPREVFYYSPTNQK